MNGSRRLEPSTPTCLVTKHSDYEKEFEEFSRGKVTPLEVFGFVDSDTCNMYDWMRWVAERSLPLCEVENELKRKMVKMRPTTTDTLKTYMRRVADRVGNALAAEMGTVFGLIFDGCSSGSFHFAAVLAVYQHGDERRERLFGLSPMEHGQTADAHIEHLKATLGVYGKDIAMVKFLIGDNCATNQSVATKLDVPLVGCASHRFAVRFLSESKDMISQIHKLMTQLRLPNHAAGLARHTSYRAVRANTTRAGLRRST